MENKNPLTSPNAARGSSNQLGWAGLRQLSLSSKNNPDVLESQWKVRGGGYDVAGNAVGSKPPMAPRSMRDS